MRGVSELVGYLALLAALALASAAALAIVPRYLSTHLRAAAEAPSALSLPGLGTSASLVRVDVSEGGSLLVVVLYSGERPARARYTLVCTWPWGLSRVVAVREVALPPGGLHTAAYHVRGERGPPEECYLLVEEERGPAYRVPEA